MDVDSVNVVKLDAEPQSDGTMPTIGIGKRKSKMWNHFVPIKDDAGKIIKKNAYTVMGF